MNYEVNLVGGRAMATAEGRSRHGTFGANPDAGVIVVLNVGRAGISSYFRMVPDSSAHRNRKGDE